MSIDVKDPRRPAQRSKAPPPMPNRAYSQRTLRRKRRRAGWAIARGLFTFVIALAVLTVAAWQSGNLTPSDRETPTRVAEQPPIYAHPLPLLPHPAAP